MKLSKIIFEIDLNINELKKNYLYNSKNNFDNVLIDMKNFFISNKIPVIEITRFNKKLIIICKSRNLNLLDISNIIFYYKQFINYR